MPDSTVEHILALVDAAPTDATAAVRLDRSGAEYVVALATEVRRLRRLCAQALPYLEDTTDQGPRDEGWKSSALLSLITELAALDAAPDSA